MDVSAPAGLKEAGKLLWQQTVGRYELGAHELCVLEDACRERDLIDRMQHDIDHTEGLMVRGSQGQEVAHPLVGELRQHRQTFRQLIHALNLPDDAGESSRSVSARKAANARWGNTG